MGMLEVQSVVKGTGKGYYGGTIRYSGAKFKISDEVHKKNGKLCIKDYSSKWMRFTDPKKAAAILMEAEMAPSKIKPIVEEDEPEIVGPILETVGNAPEKPPVPSDL